MSIKREIELSVKDREILASLARINSLLDQSQRKAKEVGSAVNSSFDSSKISAPLSKGVDSINSGLKSIAGTAAAVVGSVVFAFKGISSGLDDISRGFKSVLYDMQSGATAASGEISKLTNGLISGGQAAELLRKGRGIGFSDKDIGTIAKLGANLGLVSKDGDPGIATMKLFQSVVKGSAKELEELSPELARLIQGNKSFQAATTQSAKSQAALNVLLQNTPRLIKDMGNAADTSFGKMIGLVEQLKEMSQGLLGILGGVAKIGGAVLLPMAAGAFAGGPIGLAIGGLVSAAVLAAGLKFGQVMVEGGGTGKISTKERMSAWKDLIQYATPGALFAALTGKGGDLPKIPIRTVLDAFGMEDDTPANRKIAKEKFTALNNAFVDAGATVFQFGKGFREGFLDSVKNVEVPGIGNIKEGSEGIGHILGELAGNVAKIALALLPSMAKSLEIISSFLGGISNFLGGISDLIAMIPIPGTSEKTRREKLSAYLGAGKGIMKGTGEVDTDLANRTNEFLSKFDSPETKKEEQDMLSVVSLKYINDIYNMDKNEKTRDERRKQLMGVESTPGFGDDRVFQQDLKQILNELIKMNINRTKESTARPK